jgi:hypothetical protein
MGSTPPWAVSRLLSVIVCVIGIGPLLVALIKAQVHAATVIDQFFFSVLVLGLYLWVASRDLLSASQNI